MYNLGSYSQVCIINMFKCNRDHPEPSVTLLYDLSLESTALKLVFLFFFFSLNTERNEIGSQTWIFKSVGTVIAYWPSLEHLGAIADVLCGPFLLFT